MDIDRIIDCKCCNELFPDDPALAQQLYMALMLKYHPDRCDDPRAAEASAVINTMYGKLKKSRCMNEKMFHRAGAPVMPVNYFFSAEHEYGTEFIGERELFFLISRDAEDCFFSSPAKDGFFFREFLPAGVMAQAEIFLPHIRDIFRTDEGLLIRALKLREELPLTAVADFYGGKLPARHAAWIVSRMLGMCCYAEVRGIVLNCIAEENLLIDPKEHVVRIGGGWWFAAENGGRLIGVQSAVFDNMPVSSKTDGIARHVTDIECVKAVCRHILPDDAPDAIRNFAESISSASAVEEMDKWDCALKYAFGGRKFCNMNVSLPDIL